MTLAGDSDWTTAIESCRTHDWPAGAAALSASISARGFGRPALIARAVCRMMTGDESGAIVDLCAAEALPSLESDDASLAELAGACGEGPLDEVRRLVERDLPGSAINLGTPAGHSEPPRGAPSPPEPSVSPPAPAVVAPQEKSPKRAQTGALSPDTLAERWQQEHAIVLKLVRSRAWREAEKATQAFLAKVEATVPGKKINAVELSALQADVEATLMAIHADHSDDLLRHRNPALALIFARRASALLGPHQDSAHVVAIRIAAARAAIALPVVEEALDELEEASRHVRTREERAEVGQLLAQLGDVAREERVWILAISAYRLAAEMYRQSESDDDSARALALMLEAAANKISQQAAGYAS